MKIEIMWCTDHYRASCKDLPGSPPVGLGATTEMAVACLFWRLMFENERNDWLSFIVKDDPIVVNGKVWDWPTSYKENGR